MSKKPRPRPKCKAAKIAIKIALVVILTALVAFFAYTFLHGRFTGIYFPGVSGYIVLPMRHWVIFSVAVLIFVAVLCLLMFPPKPIKRILDVAWRRIKCIMTLAWRLRFVVFIRRPVKRAVFTIGRAIKRFCIYIADTDSVDEQEKRAVLRVIAVLAVIAATITAAALLPQLFGATSAPHILVIAPNVVEQPRNEEGAVISIAGMNLTEGTAIYANGMRISSVWEIFPSEGEDEEQTGHETMEHEEDVFRGDLYGFDRGLSFYLPPSLLVLGEVSIEAVNNPYAMVPARSHSIPLQIVEASNPQITSISITHINDMIVRLHIQGENFDENVQVLVSGGIQTAVIVHDKQNIYTYFNIMDAVLFLPSRDPDAVPVIVRNPGIRANTHIASEEYILTDLPRVDTGVTISHRSDWIGAGYNIVASGLGSWEGSANTNSREAFLHNYEQGYRLFEFSTSFGADGTLFGIYPDARTPGLTFAEEQSRALHTLMTFEDILQLMLEFEDWWLITDTRNHGNLLALQSQFDYMVRAINDIGGELINRVVVQVYDRRMYYFVANNYPFTSFIYNLSWSPDDNDKVLEFVERTGIPVVTMPTARATIEFVGALSDIGVAAFAGVSNNLRQVHELLHMGITGIYTHSIASVPNLRHMTELEIEAWEKQQRMEQNHREFIEFVDSLPEDLGDDYIRIIGVRHFIAEDIYALEQADTDDEGMDTTTADIANPNYIPHSLADAFLRLASLDALDIHEVMRNWYLYIDGYEYSHRIDDRVITYIRYNMETQQITHWVAFDPQDDFGRHDVGFARDNNRRYFLKYLDNLLQDHFLILISVTDDASGDLDDGMQSALEDIGLTMSLQGRFRYAYIAVIDGKTVIYENRYNGRIEYAEFIDNWLIEISSSGWPRNESSIRINGVEHSRNHRGINIVVLDKLTGTVVDSVAFDTSSGIVAHRGQWWLD